MCSFRSVMSMKFFLANYRAFDKLCLHKYRAFDKLCLDKYRAFDRWMGMCDVHRGIEALKREEERREKR